jgi:uncharacterized DUF497 family protein
MKATYTLEDVEFEWDSDKADANVQKHGVSFPEACEVFFDPFVYAVEPEEVDDEVREAAIGLTRRWRLLYVAFLWRNLILRIVTARQVTKTERKLYENQ